MIRNIEQGRNFYRSHSYNDKFDDFDYDSIQEWQNIGNVYFYIRKTVSRKKDMNDITISVITLNKEDLDNYETGYEIQYSIDYDYFKVIEVNKNKGHSKQDLTVLEGEDHYQGLNELLNSFNENLEFLTEFSSSAISIYNEFLSKTEMVRSHAV